MSKNPPVTKSQLFHNIEVIASDVSEISDTDSNDGALIPKLQEEQKVEPPVRAHSDNLMVSNIVKSVEKSLVSVSIKGSKRQDFREEKKLAVNIDLANQINVYKQQPVLKIEDSKCSLSRNDASSHSNNRSLIKTPSNNQLAHVRQPSRAKLEDGKKLTTLRDSAKKKNLNRGKSTAQGGGQETPSHDTVQQQHSLISNFNNNAYKLKIDKAVFVQEQKGKIEGKYKILETIGKGSFGEVKKILHKTTNELRAMKIIRKDDMSKENLETLMSEINILKQLDHPHIVKIYEFYQDNKNLYLVTEFIEGGELFDRIAKVKFLQEADAAKIMKQLLSAVVYCHNNKIVHRDLKPENLLLVKKNQDSIKVIDFGTSKVFDPNKKMNEKYGTPYYIAPEVLNRTYDEKCDVWSCGVIMFILLCGQPPFKGKTHKDIFEQIKKGSFSFSAPEWKNVTREAKVLIKKLLTFQPEMRISAEKALNDIWIKQFNPPKKAFKDPIMEQIVQNIAHIKIEKKLQQSILIYFASYMTVDIEKQQFHDLFLSFDCTGEGQLDKHELREGFLEFYNGDFEKAEEVTKDIFKKLDLNNNGQIDYSEFLILSINIKNIIQEDKLQEVFNMFDEDGSGCITADEIKKILGGNSKGVEDDEWDKIVEEVDENGDGEISFQEFKDMIYLLLSVENPNKAAGEAHRKKGKKVKRKLTTKRQRTLKDEESKHQQ